MTSYQRTSFLNDIQTGNQIPDSEKAYFRERLRNRLFDMIAREYAGHRADGTLSQAEIGRRLNKSPVQINRWLSAPGNWTLDTVSDLLLAISAAELEIGVRKLEASPPRNFLGPDLAMACLGEDVSSGAFAARTENPALFEVGLPGQEYIPQVV